MNVNGFIFNSWILYFSFGVSRCSYFFNFKAFDFRSLKRCAWTCVFSLKLPFFFKSSWKNKKILLREKKTDKQTKNCHHVSDDDQLEFWDICNLWLWWPLIKMKRISDAKIDPLITTFCVSFFLLGKWCRSKVKAH